MIAEHNRSKNMNETNLWYPLYSCLNELLDDQVNGLMQPLFEQRELDSIPVKSRTNYMIALRQLNRLEKLRIVIKEQYPNTYNNVFLKIVQDGENNPIRRDIVFQNREIEIKNILLEASEKKLSTCWLVLGPPGYGKTEFLLELYGRFDSLGWSVILVTIGDKVDVFDELVSQLGIEKAETGNISTYEPFEKGQALVTLIASKLTDLPGLVLLFDNIDTLSKSKLSYIDNFVKGLLWGWDSYGLSKNFQLRVISTARKIDNPPAFGRLGKEIVRLSPFKYEVVKQTVDHFQKNIGLDLPPTHVSSIAAYLFYITGGHPGCVTSLLRNFKHNIFMFVKEWPKGEDSKHLETVNKVIEEIKESIPNNYPLDLVKVFENVCIFRKFHENILKEFFDDMDYKEDPIQVANLLLQSGLVDKRVGIIGDDITRRLFFCQIRRENEKVNTLNKICDIAIKVYERRFNNAGFKRNWHIYATEILYQKLIKEYYTNNKRGKQLSTFFFDTLLPPILYGLVENGSIEEEERPGAIDAFLEMLDWEFEFTLNYFTSEECYQEAAFASMKKIVENFRDTGSLRQEMIDNCS